MGIFKERYRAYQSERKADVAASRIAQRRARGAARVEREEQEIKFAEAREVQRGKKKIEGLNRPAYNIGNILPPQRKSSAADHLGTFGSAFESKGSIFSKGYGSKSNGNGVFSTGSLFSTSKARTAPRKVRRVRRKRR